MIDVTSVVTLLSSDTVISCILAFAAGLGSVIVYNKVTASRASQTPAEPEPTITVAAPQPADHHATDAVVEAIVSEYTRRLQAYDKVIADLRVRLDIMEMQQSHVQAKPHKNRTKAAIVVVAASFLLTAMATYFPAANAISYRLNDNFAHDTMLNSTVWKTNGVAGNATAPLICSNCNVTSPTLSFSSGGMKVMGAKLSHQILTIQTKAPFTLPITTQANVTGLVSHGNAFIFALATKDGSRGIALQGNLNSTSGGTGYGIDVFTGANSTTTHWQSHAKLYSTPATNVQYTLRLQVVSNGTAYATVSSGSTVLGHASYLVGPGPYFLILGQSEPLPPGPALAGANSALWRAVNVQ